MKNITTTTILNFTLFIAAAALFLTACSGFNVQGEACVTAVISGVPVEICTGNGEPVPTELLQAVQRLESK